MPTQEPCRIGLLRPPEIGWYAYAQQSKEQDSSEESPEREDQENYNTFIDRWMEQYRARIEEIADDIDVPILIGEHQIHCSMGGIPGKHTRRALSDAHILTTLDPTWESWGLVAAHIHLSPLHRTVIAFSCREEFARSYIALGAMKVPLLGGAAQHTRAKTITALSHNCTRELPRGFGFFYQQEELMENAVRQALLYPNCSALTSATNTQEEQEESASVRYN